VVINDNTENLYITNISFKSSINLQNNCTLYGMPKRFIIMQHPGKSIYGVNLQQSRQVLPESILWT
jgi:hypothetical protein